MGKLAYLADIFCHFDLNKLNASISASILLKYLCTKKQKKS